VRLKNDEMKTLKKLISLLEKMDKKLSTIKITTNFRFKKNKVRRTLEANSPEREGFSYYSFFMKTLIVLFTLFIFGVFLGISSLFILFSYYAKDLPSIDKSNVIEQTTKITDREGNVLYELHGDIDRTWVDIENISPWVEKTTLSLEDRDFYTHPGFDWKGLTRVVLTHGYNTIRKVIPILPWKQTVGGSTITQQLVKNTILSNERTVKRKVQELLLARNIEQKYSKKEILELYLNNIPYGGSTYGVQAAAEKFFGINASSLTAAQSAVLASLPQSPTYLSPYGNHIDQLMDRKDKALTAMYSLGLIEELEYKDALKEELEFKPFIEKINHPHFVLYAKEKLTELLINKFGEEEGKFMVENGGLTVKTTLDTELQEIAELSVTEGINAISYYDVSNGALVAQDPKTGQILAMVGSVDFFDHENDGQVNVALAQRQPGSSIKPIIYLQSFLEGYSPATVVYDVKTDFGYNYSPNNYDLEFVGPISFRESLAQSRNVPAVKALFLAGIQDSIDLARRMGITTWGADAADRCGLSLVLGGCEVRLLDMVQAYSVIDNLGYKHSQSVLLEVTNSEGEVLYKWEQPESEEVLDSATAYQLVNVMSDREARTKTFGNSLDISRNAAVKTGTTNAYLDAWTIGFTPQIVAGVWAGNNQPSSMKHGGSFVAGPIWKRFMNEAFKLEKFIPAETWKEPDSIKRIEISTSSGKLPSEFTPEKKRKEEIFSSLNIPTETEPETMYKTAEICDPSGLLATDYCPDYLRTTLVYTFHHSIRPDLPSWEDPVIEWSKEHAEELNKEDPENPEDTTKNDLEGKKIKHVLSLDEFPTEYDTTFTLSTSHNAPKLSWAKNNPTSLALGTNIFELNIDAKYKLNNIKVLLDSDNLYTRKFIKDTKSTTISVFIDKEKYPLNSIHELKIFVIDEKELRGLLKSTVTIKEDVYPPEIEKFTPRNKKSISNGNSFYIRAEITDNKDEIERVEFFIDGSPLKTFTKGPFEYEVKLGGKITGGKHDITIRAYDSAKNVTKETHSITIR